MAGGGRATATCAPRTFRQQLARDLKVALPHLDELRALADGLWPPDEGLASADIGGYADDEVMSEPLSIKRRATLTCDDSKPP
ncbi:hypothetical protein AB0B48_17405 [Micromonospora sp. NPDC049089]|uniref:hypothetical protein n=1 Tax=unclassified Micromonospora TaxID=2617518 RepID=UPI0033DD4FFE